jgi:drug/metabolite transporter (DMT)-like permease
LDKALTSSDIALLVAYASSLAFGQVLFKIAAGRLPSSGSLLERLLAIAFSPAFISAVVLYGLLSVFWVWLLTIVPLSVAYPFVALSFVLTLLAGVLIFGEPFSIRLVVGGALVVSGLLVITG